METLDNLNVILFSSQAAWEQWLAAHHAEPQGVWLKLAKRDSGVASVSYAEALDVALCYGWIDGLKKAYDQQFWLQKFTPRRPKSIWSKINAEKAAGLIASGRMQPAGLSEVTAAQQDGRWDAAYSSQSQLSMPEDFQSALDHNPAAKAFFVGLNKQNRYAIYFRIHTAKKPETRQARIDRFIAMLANHETLYP